MYDEYKNINTYIVGSYLGASLFTRAYARDKWIFINENKGIKRYIFRDYSGGHYKLANNINALGLMKSTLLTKLLSINHYNL